MLIRFLKIDRDHFDEPFVPLQMVLCANDRSNLKESIFCICAISFFYYFQVLEVSSWTWTCTSCQFYSRSIDLIKLGVCQYKCSSHLDDYSVKCECLPTISLSLICPHFFLSSVACLHRFHAIVFGWSVENGMKQRTLSNVENEPSDGSSITFVCVLHVCDVWTLIMDIHMRITN